MDQEIEIPGQRPSEAWRPIEQHVRLYLRAHPMTRNFELTTAADEDGITASIRYASETVRVREGGPGWWEPQTPAHGCEIADHLARGLYSAWCDYLRDSAQSRMRSEL